jgi:hypothetical protein
MPMMTRHITTYQNTSRKAMNLQDRFHHEVFEMTIAGLEEFLIGCMAVNQELRISRGKSNLSD